MTNSSYLTLGSTVSNEINPIKGSRFIGIASPVDSDAAAMILLADIKSRYSDARHWCWAYQLCHQQCRRFNDDGEPSGSAGKPILAPIVGRKLMDTLVVVVRYFGGVKLGIGGLVRAYSQATNAVLDCADIITVIPKQTIILVYRYEETAQVAAALHKCGLQAENMSYTDCIRAELRVTADKLAPTMQLLTDYSGGKIKIFQD